MKKKMMQLGAVMLAVGLALTAVGARHGAAAQGSRARPAEVKTVAKSVEVAKDGEYTSKDEVAAYVRKFSGALPKNFITKRQARELGWQGGPL